MRRTFAYLPVVLWMLVIFIGSTDAGSSQNTGRLIRPLLRWIKPDVTEAQVKAVQAVVRKTGHVTVYAILALLLWRARRPEAPGQGWRWREFWIVTAGCAAYACTDEIHQAFVATRQGSFFDVLLDTAGAMLGLLLLWWRGRRRGRW